MKQILMVAVVTVALPASTATAQAVQWSKGASSNGHWYERVASPLSWDAASLAAQAVGGHLVTFGSVAEQEFVALQLMPDCAGCKYWIGGHQAVGACEPACGWTWVIPTEPVTVQWYAGDPDNGFGDEDCMALKATGTYKGVTDQVCSNAYGYFVEWQADCNGDGLVDKGQILSGQYADADGDGVLDICERGAVEWRTSQGGNGHWYARANGPFDWFGARDWCIAQSGHLATMGDAFESEWIENNIALNQPGQWWLGAIQASDASSNSTGWSTVDGTPFWVDWYPGNPNHSGQSALALNIASQLGAEIDDPPSIVRAAMIEWDADCNNDGLVDFGQIFRGELLDLDHDLVPMVCECTSDVTSNGFVDASDLAALLSVWGTSGGLYPRADINRDGLVDASDLAALLSGWGACTG